jgi:hypothetical protein
MLMSACEVKYFRYLRVGDIVWIYPAGAESRIMDLKHKPRSGLAVLTEHPLQYLNHELYRGVVVIQEPHFGQ